MEKWELEHLAQLNQTVFRTQVIDTLAEIQETLALLLQLYQAMAMALIRDGKVDEDFMALLDDIDIVVDKGMKGVERDKRYSPPGTGD